MATAVVNPADQLGSKLVSSRKSILAAIDTDVPDEHHGPVPVSNTDALLRQRRPSTSGQRSTHSRKSSVNGHKEATQTNGSANGNSNGNGLAPPSSATNLR